MEVDDFRFVCLRSVLLLSLNLITTLQSVMNQIRHRRRMLLYLMLKRRTRRLHYFRLISSNVGAILKCYHTRKRRFWMKKKTSNCWWDKIQADNDWTENFRMTKKSFDKLCELLQPDMKPHIATVREPIPSRKRIAIALYKLVTAAEYRIIAEKFGVHKSSVHNCLYRFCEALSKNSCQLIKMPDHSEVEALAASTKSKYKLPNVWGLVDTTHISILCPTDVQEEFKNSKNWTSYILQAVIDSNFTFRYIKCDIPGGEENNLFQPTCSLIETLGAVNKDYFVVGNKSCPLSPHIFKEFSSATEQEDSNQEFNERIIMYRETIHQTFCQLKSRWSILHGRIDLDYLFIPTLITACCILNNFCIHENEDFNLKWISDIEEAERLYPIPNQKNNSTVIENAMDIRNNFVQKLNLF